MVIVKTIDDVDVVAVYDDDDDDDMKRKLSVDEVDLIDVAVVVVLP